MGSSLTGLGLAAEALALPGTFEALRTHAFGVYSLLSEASQDASVGAAAIGVDKRSDKMQARLLEAIEAGDAQRLRRVVIRAHSHPVLRDPSASLVETASRLGVSLAGRAVIPSHSGFRINGFKKTDFNRNFLIGLLFESTDPLVIGRNRIVPGEVEGSVQTFAISAYATDYYREEACTTIEWDSETGEIFSEAGEILARGIKSVDDIYLHFGSLWLREDMTLLHGAIKEGLIVSDASFEAMSDGILTHMGREGAEAEVFKLCGDKSVIKKFKGDTLEQRREGLRNQLRSFLRIKDILKKLGVQDMGITELQLVSSEGVMVREWIPRLFYPGDLEAVKSLISEIEGLADPELIPVLRFLIRMTSRITGGREGPVDGWNIGRVPTDDGIKVVIYDTR